MCAYVDFFLLLIFWWGLQGFLKAQKAACGWKGGATVVVPRGKYFVRGVIFSGHCKGPIGFKLMGDLLAPKYESSINSKPLDFWLKFSYVENLSIYGGGKLYGERSSIWSYKGKCVQEGCSTPSPHVSALLIAFPKIK